jgi:hypothetical protein
MGGRAGERAVALAKRKMRQGLLTQNMTMISVLDAGGEHEIELCEA